MDEPELTRGGYSIFDEILADLTYPEVEALARGIKAEILPPFYWASTMSPAASPARSPCAPTR